MENPVRYTENLVRCMENPVFLVENPVGYMNNPVHLVENLVRYRMISTHPMTNPSGHVAKWILQHVEQPCHLAAD